MSDIARTLDYYLADDPTNHTIQQDLEQLGCPDPLAFFHLFYRWIGLIEEGKPSEAIQQIEAQNYPGGLTFLVVYYLREKVCPGPFAGMPAPTPTAPFGSLMQLDKEYARLEKLYPPDVYAQDDPSDVSRLARQAVWGHEIVKQVLNNMIERMFKQSDHEREIELRARQSERERLQAELSEMMQATLAATEKPKRKPDFTTNRQVIALGYMLRRLGVVNVDKQTQADFIEFLTGKNNKEIYDRVRELDQAVFNLGGKDAEYVREWFRKLGWSDLANDVPDTLTVRREDL